MGIIRILIIIIIAMVLISVITGEEAETAFPEDYLPEDFIHEVITETPQIPGQNTTQPVTFNVNDLPRTSNTLPQAPRAISTQNTRTQDSPIAVTTSPTVPVQNLLPAATAPTFIPQTALNQEVLSFSDVNPSDYGLTDLTSGGFNEDVWQGLTENKAQEAINQIVNTDKPHHYHSKNILVKLLTTRATAPQDATATSWLAYRAQKLIELQQSDAAYQLLRHTTPEQRNSDALLAETWSTTHLMAGELGQVCPYVQNQVRNNNTSFWRQRLILCQLLQNETQKLSLSLQLLEPEEEEKLPHFYALVRATQESSPTSRLTALSPQNPSKPLNAPSMPLINTLFGAYPTLYSSYSSHIPSFPHAKITQDITLKRLLKSTALPPHIRLKTAENLALSAPNPQNIATLKTAYNTIRFTALDVTDPIKTAKDQAHPQLARALLFQATQNAPHPSLRATAQKELYLSFKDINTLAPYFTPKTRELSPSAELAWIAPQIIKNSLKNNDLNTAKAWLTALQQNTNLSPELVARRTTLLLAVDVAQNSNINQSVTSWLATQDADQNGVYIQQVLAALDAQGLNVPTEAWQKASKTVSGSQNITTSVGPLWLRMVADALQNSRKAEVLLLLLKPLSEAKITDLDPLTLANIITGLGYIEEQDLALTLVLELILQDI